MTSRLFREAREAKGFTQMELAHMVGTEPSHISRIENGRVRPNIGLALKLEDALGVPVRDLFRHAKNEAA